MNTKVLIGTLVGVVIGLVLFPIVNDSVNAVNTTGVTGASLIKLIPFFYILLIVGGAIGGGIAGFKG
jgi:hypothetical protein